MTEHAGNVIFASEMQILMSEIREVEDFAKKKRVPKGKRPKVVEIVKISAERGGYFAIFDQPVF